MLEQTGNDVFGEVPRLDFGAVAGRVRENQNAAERRRVLMDWIDDRLRGGGSIPATSVVVEDIEIKTLCLEAVRGVERSEGQVRSAERRLESEWRVRLATIDGRPLADRRKHAKGEAHLRGVKYGQRSMGGAEAREYEARGGTLNLYREYGATFDVDLVEAHRVLSKYGWRLAPEREKWIVYEVGGPLEAELARWLDERGNDESNPTLKARARAICPSAFGEPGGDDKPRARR